MPYLITLIVFLAIDILSLWILRNKINWKKYRNCFLFTFILGVLQIYGSQNFGSDRAWHFPENNERAYLIICNVDVQDVLFIPIMFSLFYCFMFYVTKLNDVFGKTFRKIFLLLILFIEAYIYQAGGGCAETLIVVFTMAPLLILLITGFDFSKVNITAMFLTLLFCLFIGAGWDYIGVKLGHWVYNLDCDLLGANGWIKEKWHISTVFQYAISGFIVMFFSWNYFHRHKRR